MLAFLLALGQCAVDTVKPLCVKRRGGNLDAIGQVGPLTGLAGPVIVLVMVVESLDAIVLGDLSDLFGFWCGLAVRVCRFFVAAPACDDQA